MSNSNPYASSEAVRPVPRVTCDRLPLLCIVMFCFSLLCCLLKIPFLALAIMEEFGGGMGYDPAFAYTMIAAIATSAGMVLFGLTANTLLLVRIRWGIPLAVLFVLSTIASIGVETWVTVLARSLPMYRGGVLHDGISIAVLLLRITLLVLFIGALSGFIKWSRQTT